MLEIAGHIPEICTNLKMLKHMPQISGHTQETLSNLKIFVSFQKKILNLHVNFLLWKYALNFQGGRYSLSGLLSGKKMPLSLFTLHQSVLSHSLGPDVPN